ncbi:hypothetical protein B0H15DRAFT_947585 [Mycena belliarum]|uniref:F-box domain-containing protein n=1 Tax=Mycena belliarum TaxID=1033014 RepID=A0AAD6XR93_9AGAR|nr:hypothetical protein B0H15DRAFT_947585 [Mycena belliae]
MTVVSLPPEVWMYIQRLATSETSPLTLAYADRFQYVPHADPLEHLEGFLRAACSFALVCRLFNSVATDILYENVRVDERFPILRTALEGRDAGRLVRSIRLSPRHSEHNYEILALCPFVQVIVQPDDGLPIFSGRVSVVSSPSREPVLPELLALRHVYCSELLIDSRLLIEVLQTSPNIEYLSVMQSPYTLPVDALALLGLPAIANLKGLALPLLVRQAIPSSIFRMNLQGLTRLHCFPSTLALAEFPTLPSLHVLEILGSRSTMFFPLIFSRCPRLHELCYDVRNSQSLRCYDVQGRLTPLPRSSSLSIIHLHSAVTVEYDWLSFRAHFGLFLGPGFPVFPRLVLHGSQWHRVVADPKFTSRFVYGLRRRGCRLEFPEGHVLM